MQGMRMLWMAPREQTADSVKTSTKTAPTQAGPRDPRPASNRDHQHDPTVSRRRAHFRAGTAALIGPGSARPSGSPARACTEPTTGGAGAAR